MAMIKCTECGQPVSTRARACPHCGAPPPTAASARLVLLGSAVAAVVGLGVALASRQGPARSSPWDAAAPMIALILVLIAVVAIVVAKRRS
jgi:hypothetical protein